MFVMPERPADPVRQHRIFVISLIVVLIMTAIIFTFVGIVRTPWAFLGYLLLIPNAVKIVTELRRGPQIDAADEGSSGTTAA